MKLQMFITLILSISCSSNAIDSLNFQDTIDPFIIPDSLNLLIKFDYCEKEKPFDVTVIKSDLINDTACHCSIVQKTTAATVRNDYTPTAGVGIHKLYIRPTTWNKARKICAEDGAHLAIVNSEAEAQVLVEMLTQAKNSIIGSENPGEAFVGLHDLFEEGDWVTVKGEPMHTAGYDKWTNNYGHNPDNFAGRQNCGAIVEGGGFDDVFCDFNHAFFCELPQIC